MKINPTPRIQWSRRIGNLFQVAYGLPGREQYGYGSTRKEASINARKARRIIRDQARRTLSETKH